MTNSQGKLARLRSLKSIFRHGKRRLYGIDSMCTRPGGGGASACRMGSLRNQSIAQLWTRFSGFSQTVWSWEKGGRYLDVFNNNMAKIFFWSSKYSWNGGALNSKVRFRIKKLQEKLVIGKCFVTKKYVRFKENRKWGGSIRKKFYFHACGSQKTAFSDASKVQNFLSHFFTPKKDKFKNVLW